MKKRLQQKFPPGWKQEKVQQLIGYYDNQSDDEGAAEIETARDATGETWMSVPTELVSAIALLIEGHKKNGKMKTRSATRTRSPKVTSTRMPPGDAL